MLLTYDTMYGIHHREQKSIPMSHHVICCVCIVCIQRMGIDDENHDVISPNLDDKQTKVPSSGRKNDPKEGYPSLRCWRATASDSYCLWPLYICILVSVSPYLGIDNSVPASLPNPFSVGLLALISRSRALNYDLLASASLNISLSLACWWWPLGVVLLVIDL